nr:hypothetical protein [Tanacetum cinerariifolium]
MDHDQTNEPSGPHETYDGDETGQINDEGQPNNDEIETNEREKAQDETRPTRIRTQPSRFKDFIVQIPPSVKHPTSISNQVTYMEGKRAIDSKWVYKIKFWPNGSITVLVLIYVDDVIITANNLTKIQETKKQLDDQFSIKDLGQLRWDSHFLENQKQSVASRSSDDTEYKAASIVNEIIWVRWLLSELHVHNPLATLLFCDNQAARHIANNLVFYERTKHVEMDCYFVREIVESKKIISMKINSKIQIADLLTKGLPAHQLQFLLGKIGITDLHAPS